MKSVSIYWWAVVILATVVCISCEDDEPATLSSADRKLVDSIYRRDISYVRKRADSLCDANYAKYFEYYSDSLKQAYIEGVADIEDYLKPRK